MRRIIAISAILGTLFAAGAQDMGEPFSLKNYPQRAQEAVEACTADPNGTACFMGMKSVLPTTMDALTFLGYEDTYENAAPLLREMASFPVPEIAMAAIYALARLGPTSADLPALREALLSDVSAVRRAAIGALKLLPDTQAQELYGRAVPNPGAMPSSYSSSDRLPFVPADTGVKTWPQGTHYLFFHNRVPRGTYVFTTEADVASTAALFEAQAGGKAVGMGEIEARFGEAHGKLLAEWKTRNETLGAVQAIVLAESPEPSRSAPVLLALVYEDYALGRTGFALVRLPGEPFAAPPLPPQAAPPPPPTGDAAIWYAGGTFIAKDGATEDDAAAWREVLDSEGEFAAAYLEKFPGGAYRTEAEAMLAAPVLETDLDVYSETDTIQVHWRNLAEEGSKELTLGDPSDESLFNTLSWDPIRIQGSAGDATVNLPPYIEAGLYDLRVVDETGEPLATTQIRVALSEATLSLARDIVKPGEDVVVSYKNMAGTPRDTISIAKAGSAKDEIGVVSVQADGKPEGNVTLRAPQEPGDYEVRAWFKGERRLRGRVRLTVKGPDQPPEIADPSQPSLAIAATEFAANDRILIRFAGFPDAKGNYIALASAGEPLTSYVAYVDVREAQGIAELKLPPEPGAYELRAFFGGKQDAAAAIATLSISAPEGVAMATLSVDKTSYAPGETIGIGFKGMSGAKTDYVAIAAKGSRYRSYESYVYTKGATEGRAELKAPANPGDYEIRAFYKDDSSVLRGSVPVSVTATP